MSLPRDARGRLAFAGGLLCILGAIGVVARARHLQHRMEVEGVPATPDWTIALRSARRPDDLIAGAAMLGLAGGPSTRHRDPSATRPEAPPLRRSR